MQFVILCKDKPDGLDLRMATRQVHLDYLNNQGGANLIGAGPFLDDQDRSIGSMLIVDFPSEDEARDFAANDPYAKAGLFTDVEIRRWRWVVKPPAA